MAKIPNIQPHSLAMYASNNKSNGNNQSQSQGSNKGRGRNNSNRGRDGGRYGSNQQYHLSQQNFSPQNFANHGFGSPSQFGSGQDYKANRPICQICGKASH